MLMDVRSPPVSDDGCEEPSCQLLWVCGALLTVMMGVGSPSESNDGSGEPS
jgi:hypothetical protein